MQIKTLKRKLFDLRFLLSKIKNIRWIGRSILEFLVDEEYSSLFLERMNEFNGYVRNVDNFDIFQSPRPFQKESEMEEAKDRAIRGLVLQRDKSNSPLVHDFFDQLLHELGKDALKIASKYATPSKISEEKRLISTLTEEVIPEINALREDIIAHNVINLSEDAQVDWLHEKLASSTLKEDMNNSLTETNSIVNIEGLIHKVDIDFRVTKIAAFLAKNGTNLSQENFKMVQEMFNYGLEIQEDYIPYFVEEWKTFKDMPEKQEKILLQLLCFDEILEILQYNGDSEMDMTNV